VGGDAVRFVILGPLEVRSDGTDVTPRAAKPRALLVRLLVDANRVVSADQLVEDLWDERPPPSASATLQGYVSQLRKAVGTDRLLTRAGGYELVVEPGELDRDVFTAEVAECRSGDGEDVPARVRAALAMWRGDALSDAAGAAWAAPEIARLDDLRAVAMETGIDAQIAAGAYRDAVTAAEVATTAYPLRERVWAQLMTALYHDGRQADALRAFQRIRTLLAEELGIEPSRELVELETHMVRQEIDTEGAPNLAPSSGALTFLFTDLVSSTQLWEENADAMSTALATHDALLRDAFERCGGTVVKSTGDGTFAVFAEPEAAVRAASDALRSVVERDWGAIGPLQVRFAAHTGVAERREHDYFGPALNRAARLLSIAHGGQK
jgi:DNA-binding SARP family transcriptional activator